MQTGTEHRLILTKAAQGAMRPGMTQPRLILFDCDGTLVDTAATIVESFTQGFLDAGVAAPPPEEILSIVGLSLPIATATLCAPRDIDTHVVLESYRKAYATIATGRIDPLFPGTLDALDAIETPATLMGIVTGKSRRGLVRILSQHSLSDRFITTQTADDAASKPAPDMVHHALSATGADASRTVVIGDTSFDIEMALAAGAHAIAVTWGNHPEERLMDAGAHALAHTMDELPALIDRLTPQ